MTILEGETQSLPTTHSEDRSLSALLFLHGVLMPQEDLSTPDSACSGTGLMVKKLHDSTRSPAEKTEVRHGGRTAKSTFNEFIIYINSLE